MSMKTEGTHQRGCPKKTSWHGGIVLRWIWRVFACSMRMLRIRINGD